MLRFVDIVERWALSLWVGALAGFAFIFAPAAFARLSGDLDLFASIVVRALENLAVFGYACGGVAVVTSLIAIGARRSRRAIARSLRRPHGRTRRVLTKRDRSAYARYTDKLSRIVQHDPERRSATHTLRCAARRIIAGLRRGPDPWSVRARPLDRRQPRVFGLDRPGIAQARSVLPRKRKCR